MSRAKRIPDAERTATMLDLLRRRTEGGASTSSMGAPRVLIEEVAPGTGAWAQRYADVLILDVWPSGGMCLKGYELKASRDDLRKELANLEKHKAVARYCDAWSLIAWDEKVIAGFDIPDDWGVMLTVDGEHGRELKRVRNAAKRSPEPWPKPFVCSMVRNAHQQAPGAAWVARAVLEASTRSHRDGKADGERAAARSLEASIAKLRRALYGDKAWHYPAGVDALIEEAAARLEAVQASALSLDVGNRRVELEHLTGRQVEGAANRF